MDIGVLSLFTFAAVAVADTNFSIEMTSNSRLIGFLEDVHKVGEFQSVLILKHSNESFANDFGEELIKDISTSLEVPLILSTETSSSFIRRKFNNNLLVIIHLNSISRTVILQRLLENLRQMRSCKMIFLINNPSTDEDILSDLFKFSWENDMMNVLAIFCDFSNTATFYRYTNFPVFTIEENVWMEEPPTDGYFPNRMRDLKGHELPVIFGGSEPKMIISQDKHGKQFIGGYAGHLFLALAKKHNANVNNPKINKLLSARELIPLVLNNTVEISAATTYCDIPMDWFTYPYDNLDWCLMLPIEPSIPIHKVFMIVFQWGTLLTTIGIIVILSVLLETATYLSGRKTFLLNYFFNDSCLRGALGQSFLEVPNASYNIKFIYLLICLIGIILVTSYNAFLQTYITSPPSEKRIESFDDLLASDIKVYSLRPEYNGLSVIRPIFKNKYSGMFVFENNFDEYGIFRDRLDPNYAYMTNNVRWVIVQEHQRIFSRPLFRQPKRMCFLEGIQMSFPIKENSIYLDILNFLMLQTQSSGLLEFWQKRSFSELIETGKLKLIDLTSKPEFVQLKVEDLQVIWIGMGVAFVLATLCFVTEMLTFKLKKV